MATLSKASSPSKLGKVSEISPHSNSWCHLCGEQKDRLVDIWYPPNAEHALIVGEIYKERKKYGYIRICKDCGKEIVKRSEEGYVRDYGDR